MSLPDGSPSCAQCGSYGMTGPILCDDCAAELRAELNKFQTPYYLRLEERNQELSAENERLRTELKAQHALVKQWVDHGCELTAKHGELRAEIIKWIDAGNAGTKLINEQRVIIQQQDKYIKWFRATMREAIEDAQLIDNTPDEATEVRRELLAVLDKEGNG